MRIRRALVLGTCMVFLSSGLAHALLTVGSSYQANIQMTDGNYSAGSFDVTYLDTSEQAFAYCVDLTHFIIPGSSYPYSVNNAGMIHGIAVPNADKVAWLLATYAWDARGVDSKERALQASIWTVVSPGLTMVTTAPEYSLYDAMLTNLNNHPTIPNLVANYNWITPSPGTNPFAEGQGLVSAPVPIPSAMVLLGSGLAGLVGIGRFRRKHSK